MMPLVNNGDKNDDDENDNESDNYEDNRHSCECEGAFGCVRNDIGSQK